MSRSAGGSSAALQGKPWYYGPISRTQCDTLLNQNGHDGDFLIRDSETNVRFFKYFQTNNMTIAIWKIPLIQICFTNIYIWLLHIILGVSFLILTNN